MMLSTYAPPVPSNQLPTSLAGWRHRTGLTAPEVLAEHVRARVGEHETIGGAVIEPVYADFFRLR